MEFLVRARGLCRDEGADNENVMLLGQVRSKVPR